MCSLTIECVRFYRMCSLTTHLLHLPQLSVRSSLHHRYRQMACGQTRLENAPLSLRLSRRRRFTVALLLRCTLHPHLPQTPNLGHDAHAVPLPLVPYVRSLCVCACARACVYVGIRLCRWFPKYAACVCVCARVCVCMYTPLPLAPYVRSLCVCVCVYVYTYICI